MIVSELFYYIYYPICFLIGIPLNALLVWLVIYRSASEMRQYRPILLLATVTDIVYLTDFLVVMPVIATKDGCSGTLSLGPFGSLPRPWSFIVLMTSEFLFTFSCYSIAVPFIYRYYVICRDKQWGLKEFIAMLIVPVIICFEDIFMNYYAGYVGSAEGNAVANEQFGFTTDSNKTYAIPLFTETQGQANLLAFNVMFFTGVNYALIVIYGRRLYRHLNAMTGQQTQEHARPLNKQITTTLILQSVMPLLLEYLPTIMLTCAVASGINTGNVSLYMYAPPAWIPIVDPLVSMWVVKVYRKEISGWIRSISSKRTTNDSNAIAIPKVITNAPPPLFAHRASVSVHERNATRSLPTIFNVTPHLAPG